MEINKIKRSLLVLFFSFLAIGVQAQLEQAVKKIFARRYNSGQTCSFETGFGLHLSGEYAEIIGGSPAQRGEYADGNGADEAPDGYRRLREVCTAATAYRLSAAVH